MPLIAAILYVSLTPWLQIIVLFLILFLAVKAWRSHWISGLAVLCAPLLVFGLATFPSPLVSPVGWAVNSARAIYYRAELQRSYLEARRSGQPQPVGYIYLDGFGSLTSGLAYDPSGQIALPINKRSNSWNDGPGQTELGLDNLEAHHLFGPYYQWFHS
jgi:hypothetical protein